jgi:hypothetical protein
VAASGAAAAGAVGAFFSGVASALGTLLAWLWGLTVFLFKTALLVGVAYAGWQWLQSRREQQAWSSGAYNPSSPSASTRPSGTYGAVSGSVSAASPTPAAH